MSATPPSTRERLLTEARRLFAERGYEGTSVGAIEEAAGLKPRRGALYKHFADKEELFRSVVEQHTDAIHQLAGTWEVGPGDLREQLEGMAHATLGELHSEFELTRIVMKEGARFPDLTQAFRDAIVLRGHRAAAQLLDGYVEATGARIADPAATAAVLSDALIGFTLNEALFGPGSEGIDAERFVAAWAESILHMITGATQ